MSRADRGGKNRRWRTFSLRLLLLATFTAGVFCGGYRAGYHVGVDHRFESLIELIQATVSPSEWGQSSPATPLPARPSAAPPGAAFDPFALPVESGGETVDPFAAPTDADAVGSPEAP